MSSRAFWAEQADLMRDSTELLKPVKSESKAESNRFTISFNKLENYKGEFGFDVLSENLSNKLTHVFDSKTGKYELVDNSNVKYSILKKEYIHVKEVHDGYYAPWLHVMPNSKASLEVKLKFLGQVKKETTFIRVSTPLGWNIYDNSNNLAQKILPNSEENEFKVPINITDKNEIQKIVIEASNQTLCNDTPIQFYDKDDNIIGQIQLMSNEAYSLPVKVVVMQPLNKQAGTHDKLSTSLNARDAFRPLSLLELMGDLLYNQAGIRCVFETKKVDGKDNVVPLELTFDDTKWREDGYVTGTESEIIFKDKNTDEDLLFKFMSSYVEKFEKDKLLVGSKPIVIFVTLNKYIDAANFAGIGQLIPFDARQCIIFGNGLGSYTLFAHEVGHVLGLEHIFLNEKSFNNLLNTPQEISRIKGLLKDEETNVRIYEQYPDSNPNKTTLLASSKKNRDYYAKKDLENQLNTATCLKNPYRFSTDENKRGTTDNVMDYFSKQNEYFRWQIKIMQKEVGAYYGYEEAKQ